MIKCVIFDMDGTIGDTLPLCIVCFQKALEEAGGKSFSTDEITIAFGPSEEGTIARLLGANNDECNALYQQYYLQLHDEYCPAPFTGMAELLESLRKDGLMLALVTGKGKRSLETTLRKFGMEDTFDAVETGSFSGPDKPAAIGRVLEKLGLQPDEAVYVGDSDSDMDAARQAGVQAIAAAWAETADTEALKTKQPLAVCSSIRELKGFLYGLQGAGAFYAGARYARQVSIEAIGTQGQKKLGESRVLVVGAGGLGSPVLLYLCAAGIGHLGIVDFDKISESNLNRQILHSEFGIGIAKTTSAKARLQALNSKADIKEHNLRLDEDNIEGILADYDMVVDCVDSMQARILVAKACCKLGKPLVEAGIESFSGFIMSYIPGHACYCCLHGAQPRQQQKPISVLGATAGATGSIQTAECIKLLLGIGEPLLDKALYFNLLYHDYDIIEVSKNPDCPVCAGE